MMLYNRFKYLITVILLGKCFGLGAQLGAHIDIKTYNEGLESLFLLKNNYSKIPIKEQDIFGIKQYYSESLTNLPTAMELYFPIADQVINAKEVLKNYVNSSGISIVSLDLSASLLDQESINQLEKIIEQKEVITILFDSENKIKTSAIDFTRSSHLIYVRGNTDLHQSLAIQLLFGGIGTKNKLDVDLNETFKKGKGYELQGGLRLSYAPPESVGMDRALLTNEISTIAQSAIDSGAFPGCQVLVVKDQKIVFHQTWGHHTYDQKQAVQLHDIYDFASVTKVTSALPALMKLHGDGRLNLDDPLKKYFPKFKGTNKADLSIRPILAHHAKLKPWIPYWRNTIKKNGKFKCKTFKKKQSRRFPIKITDQLFLHRKYKNKIYQAIKESPLNNKSGYVYSGLIFYLWPEIVSDLVEEDFETYLKQTFYQPLGASSITYNPDRHFPLSRIIPTERDTFFRKVQIHGKVHDEGAVMMGGVSANAGLFGSALDLAKLMQMYLNGGEYGGTRFIAAASVAEFTRCQYCEEENRRGLGFDKPLIEYHPQKSSVAKAASPASYGHSGYTGTFTWVDPKYDLIYIFFSNRVYPTRENRKIYQLNVRPNIHEVIYDSFLEK